MNILMMTNTYLPHVGGVARSVATFARLFQSLGNRVLVVAPEFDGLYDDHVEAPVLRVPAIQHFNGSDFSMALPVSPMFNKQIQAFKPDIIHSHHPFLIGSSALRTAALFGIPHVFTHHTMYELYTHYVPGGADRLSEFVKRLATQYANLYDFIFAPSDSIKQLLRSRGVKTPLRVVPTGVDSAPYSKAQGSALRMHYDIPVESFVVGHVGRLAPEKNLPFLAESIARFLRRDTNAYCLIVGSGSSERIIRKQFARFGVSERLIMTGVLTGKALISAYSAMDLFAFASTSETQGMVVIEAMAAGTPVIAIDSPGIREVVEDGRNGRLLHNPDSSLYATVINEYAELSPTLKNTFGKNAELTAQTYDSECMVGRALEIYQSLVAAGAAQKHRSYHIWEGLLPLIRAEWELVKSYADCASGAILSRATDTEFELKAG